MPQADFSNSETRVGQVRQASRPQQQRASKPSPVFSDDHKRTLSRHAQVSAPQAATIDGHRQTIDEDSENTDADFDASIQLADSRYRAGDYEGSITASLSALERSPDHPIALSLKASSERQLQDMPQRRVNQAGLRPRLQLSQNEVQWQVLTPKESFLLSLIDGRTTTEDIIDISTLAKDEVLEMLVKLIEQGLIGLPN